MKILIIKYVDDDNNYYYYDYDTDNVDEG